MLDDSSSVSLNNWKKELEFTKIIADTATIKEEGGRASVITFSTNSYLKIKFSAHKNYNSFVRAVENLKQIKRGTNIPKALNLGLNSMFKTSNGMREKSEKIAVLITDGQDWPRGSTTIQQYKNISKKYRDRKIKLLVIGVGPVEKNKLKQLVEDPNDLYIATNFKNLLKKFVKGVAESVQGACKGMSNTWYISFALV